MAELFKYFVRLSIYIYPGDVFRTRGITLAYMI